MTLNSSGPISLGGSTSGQSVNLELNQSATAQISFNDTNVRTLTGTSSGTALVMPTNFYGKSNGSIVTSGLYSVSSPPVTFNYYGYSGNSAFVGSTFGSITGNTFNGATILAVFSLGVDTNNGSEYLLYFSGNRSAGFFNTLTVNGVAVAGSVSGPTYDSGTNSTQFALNPSVVTTSAFYPNGSNYTVVMT